MTQGYIKTKALEIGQFSFDKCPVFIRQSFSMQPKIPLKSKQLTSRKSQQLLNTKNIKYKLSQFLKQNQLNTPYLQNTKSNFLQQQPRTTKYYPRQSFRATFSKRKQTNSTLSSYYPKQKMQIIEDQHEYFKKNTFQKLQQLKVRRKGSQLGKYNDALLIEKRQSNLCYRILTFMRKKMSNEKYSLKPPVAEAFHSQQHKKVSGQLLNIKNIKRPRKYSRIGTHEKLQPWAKDAQVQNIQQDL